MTTEERIAQLEQRCESLQQQIDRMKNNPVISFESANPHICQCTSSLSNLVGNSRICLTCNKPLTQI